MAEDIIFIIAHCAYPPVGPNVSVDNYTYSSGVEGSQITYHCQPGLVPGEHMVANCTRNGRWNPDPAQLICEGIIHTCMTCLLYTSDAADE